MTYMTYPSPAQINADPVSPAVAERLAVGSWRPAGSPGVVRFAGMYREREWRQRSTALEFAYAGLLAGDGQVTESVLDAVSRMYEELASRHGGDGRVAFFARDAVPEDPAAELERLRNLPAGPLALDELMTAFIRASYAGVGLPGEVADALSRPAGRRGRYAAGSAYREVHDSRGMRRVGGDDGLALRLLRTYAALGASPVRQLALRDALIAWAIPADLQSLHEILRASHRLGLGTAEEREVALRDGAGLHSWVADTVRTSEVYGGAADGFSSGRFRPPHRALYDERMTFGGDISSSGWALPGDLVDLVEGALAGNLPFDEDLPELEMDRGRVLDAWLGRYGEAGREALERLDPAHLTALYLYSGPDGRLMESFLNGERFGAGMGRRLVRLNAWAITRREAEDRYEDEVPTTLRRQDGFPDLFDEMADVDDLRISSPEVAGLRDRLNVMADAVYEELALHVDMTIEALEILPPLNHDVWWAERAIPDRWGGHRGGGPVHGRDEVTRAFFRSTQRSRERAFDGIPAESVPVPPGTHSGLVHVPRSTARNISPFAAWPQLRQAVYPPGASFRVFHRFMTVPRRGRRFESIEVREVAVPGDGVPGAVGGVAKPGFADDELFGDGPVTAATAGGGQRFALVEHLVRGKAGGLIGVASFDDADWAVRQEPYGRLDGATGFVSWSHDSEGRRVRTQRALPGGGTAGGTFFFATRGGVGGFAWATEDGGVWHDDGSFAGRELRRVLRRARDHGFRSVTVIGCGPGRPSLGEARARAKRIANGSGLRTYLAWGRTAVSDGQLHLLEDADGRETGWVTEDPDGGAGRGEDPDPTPARGEGSGVVADVPAPPDGYGRSEPSESEEAGREYEEALSAYLQAEGAAKVLTDRVRGGGPGGSGDVASINPALREVGRAQRRLEESLDRLRDLGDPAADAVVAEMVPRVPRSDDERRRTAALVTAADLDEDSPRL
ncbi:hypothetical protein, partial [Streptomyces sp. SYSU K217416]